MAKAIRANQEFFDLLVGDIFARLHRHFPEPTDIYASGIWYNDEFEKSEFFDDGADRVMKLYAHTVQWLSDEGFLRFSQVTGENSDGDEGFLNCVLTSQGLAALRKTPASLVGPGETLGEKIEAAAKDIGSDAAKATMKQLVGAALGWIARSVI